MLAANLNGKVSPKIFCGRYLDASAIGDRLVPRQSRTPGESRNKQSQKTRSASLGK